MTVSQLTPRKELQSEYILKTGQKLSDSKLLSSIDFNKANKISIDAPTGCGKSWYLINYLKDNNIPFVFVVDTSLLGNQLAKEFGIEYYDATCMSKPKSNQVVSLYNHTDKFSNNSNIIMDEAHCLITTNNYRKAIINQNLNDSYSYRTVVMLSGTPLSSGDGFYDDVKNVVVRYENPVQNTINLVDYVDTVGAIVDLVMVERSKGRKVVVSMLNKSEYLYKAIKALEQKGISNIAVINSTTKPNGESEIQIESTTGHSTEFYQEMVDNKEISADVVFTTYTQGYSMYGTNYSLILAPSNNRHSYIDIVQMMRRFRNMETFDAYMLYKEKKNYQGGFIADLNEYMTAQFNNKKKAAEEAYKTLHREKRSQRAVSAQYQLNPSRFEFITDNGFTIDYQAAALSAVMSITNECYNSIYNFNKIMSPFNIQVEMNYKSDNTAKVSASVAEMTKNVDTLVDDYISIVVDRDTTKEYYAELGKVHTPYTDLIGFNMQRAEAIVFLKENLGKPTKQFNEAFNEIRLRMSSDNKSYSLRKLAFKAFNVKQSYTSEQILSIVDDIFDTVGKTKETSKKQATTFLKSLFEVEESKKKVNGKTVRYYKIKGNK